MYTGCFNKPAISYMNCLIEKKTLRYKHFKIVNRHPVRWQRLSISQLLAE